MTTQVATPVATPVDCPTFIDLAAAAAAQNLVAGADPFGADAVILPLRAGDCAVFATRAAGAGASVEQGGDCFVVVIEGVLTISTAAGAITLGVGQSAVMARGAAYDWASDGATVIGMRYRMAPAGDGAVIGIDNNAALAPSNPPALDVLTSDVPACRSATQFTSLDTVFKCGVWDSTPYQRKAIYFGHSELMHLLEGEVSFIDEAGREGTFRKGDTFIIEQGARCTWASYVHVAKIYGYYRPLDA